MEERLDCLCVAVGAHMFPPSYLCFSEIAQAKSMQVSSYAGVC